MSFALLACRQQTEEAKNASFPPWPQQGARRRDTQQSNRQARSLSRPGRLGGAQATPRPGRSLPPDSISHAQGSSRRASRRDRPVGHPTRTAPRPTVCIAFSCSGSGAVVRPTRRVVSHPKLSGFHFCRESTCTLKHSRIQCVSRDGAGSLLKRKPKTNSSTAPTYHHSGLSLHHGR